MGIFRKEVSNDKDINGFWTWFAKHEREIADTMKYTGLEKFNDKKTRDVTDVFRKHLSNIHKGMEEYIGFKFTEGTDARSEIVLSPKDQKAVRSVKRMQELMPAALRKKWIVTTGQAGMESMGGIPSFDDLIETVKQAGKKSTVTRGKAEPCDTSIDDFWAWFAERESTFADLVKDTGSKKFDENKIHDDVMAFSNRMQDIFSGMKKPVELNISGSAEAKPKLAFFTEDQDASLIIKNMQELMPAELRKRWATAVSDRPVDSSDPNAITIKLTNNEWVKTTRWNSLSKNSR